MKKERRQRSEPSIRARVLGGFASALVVMAILGAIGLSALSSMDSLFQRFNTSASATFDISELNRTAGQARLEVEKYFANSNEETAEAALVALNSLEARSAATADAFRHDTTALAHADNLVSLSEQAQVQLTEAIATRQSLDASLAIMSGHAKEARRALVAAC